MVDPLQREGFKLGYLIPYWGWVGIVLIFNYNNLRPALIRDFKIVLSRPIFISFWPSTILGFLPLFGTAPQSETGPSILLLYNAATLVVITICSFAIFIIASIPGICAVYIYLSRWRSSRSLSRPRHQFGPKNEHWIFINGICNTRGILELNRLRIERLFGRSVTNIFNPSEGVVLDLIECIFGRTLGISAAPSNAALKEVSSSLRNKDLKKVVLIGHSQGAILVSTILRDLSKDELTEEQLKKLEVYTFASPASEMNDCGGLIYCEHYCNYYDAIAQIGILHPLISYQPERVFVNTQRKGHLLNEHYLKDFEKKPYHNSINQPRLYSYLQ